MARSAQLICFLMVTMALFFSSYAYYQDETDPRRPCKGGPMDRPTECGSQCPLTCEKPNPGPCILSCKLNACECVSGYLRRWDGMCVTERGCKRLPPKGTYH
ncbi:chymotrypsin inhibitor-like [Venturia canescens]|uniref:chymotrypsin inhibitor-like n=1 Tax=Venturia canescens TaxID=32260 RepID=UPI001C9C1CE2|nr:chymotrypsin inhibitor-like [Venturia canescens]